MTNTLEENKKKLNTYVKYCKSYGNQYYNAFERVNLGENSISQLLAWLLDTKWVNDNDTIENQIHREFTFEFLKLIKNAETENDKSILQNKNEEELKELANGIHSIQDKDNIDILLVNEDEQFVCVIENKKRAKLSVSKKERNNEERILQIEKYYNYINKHYEKYDKKFVYLCAEKVDTNKTIKERLTDKVKVPDDIVQNLKIKINDKIQGYENIKDEKVIWLLNKFNYTLIKHSDIALILYNILLNKCHDNFCEKILKPIDEEKMMEMAKKLLELYRTPKNLDKDKISGNAKMFFYDKFSNLEYKYRLDILCQYIEYWELHNGEGYLQDNLYGYTKIINGKYLWDICKDIKNENSEEWKNVETIASELEQEKCNDLKHIVNELNKKD